MAHVTLKRVHNHNDPSGSSQIVDFGTNRKREWDFLLGLNSSLVLFCRVSDILELLYTERHYPTPIPAKISGCSPWSRSVIWGLR